MAHHVEPSAITNTFKWHAYTPSINRLIPTLFSMARRRTAGVARVLCPLISWCVRSWDTAGVSTTSSSWTPSGGRTRKRHPPGNTEAFWECPEIPPRSRVWTEYLAARLSRCPPEVIRRRRSRPSRSEASWWFRRIGSWWSPRPCRSAPRRCCRTGRPCRPPSHTFIQRRHRNQLIGNNLKKKRSQRKHKLPACSGLQIINTVFTAGLQGDRGERSAVWVRTTLWPSPPWCPRRCPTTWIEELVRKPLKAGDTKWTERAQDRFEESNLEHPSTASTTASSESSPLLWAESWRLTDDVVRSGCPEPGTRSAAAGRLLGLPHRRG